MLEVSEVIASIVKESLSPKLVVSIARNEIAFAEMKLGGRERSTNNIQ